MHSIHHKKILKAKRVCVRRTELADVIIAGGLRHGCDGQQRAVISSECLAERLLSVVDVGSAQSTQLLQMHLTHTSHHISLRSVEKWTAGQEVITQYLQGRVGVWVMIGEVTDVVLVMKSHSKGDGVIGFAFLTSGCNGAP